MSGDRGWPRLRRVLFVPALLGTLALPHVAGPVAAAQGSAPAAKKKCADVVVLGARGSDQEPQGETGSYLKAPYEGLGPEVFALADKLQKLGTTDGLSVERLAVEYPAIDRGYTVEKWAGLNGQTILESMEEGAGALKKAMAGYGDCATTPKFVLVGYSQGAGVVRLALGSLPKDDRSNILAAVNIADPYFTGQNGKMIGNPDLRRVGLATAGWQSVEDQWAGNRSYHVCVQKDVVCQAYQTSLKQRIFDRIGRAAWGPLTASFDAASLARAVAIHLNAYKKPAMVNYTAQTVYDDTMKGLVKKGGGSPPKGPVVDTTVAGIGAALVIDDSGSMMDNDPDRRRVVASKALISAMDPTDGVGIVKFTSAARELASFRRVSTGRTGLEDSLAGLTSSGQTDIGRGVAAGCSTLQSSPVKANFGIMLTDGDGSYNDEAKCFADRSWPLFIFGLGSDPDDDLLEEIAESTGGDYRNLADVSDLVCEFQQVRNFVATGVRGDCSAAASVAPGEERAAKVSVPYGTDQVTFTHSFPGDPVGMSVTTPRGQVFAGEESDGSSVRWVDDVGYQSLVVRGPEPGDWTVNALGPADSEGDRSFSLSSVLVGEPHAVPVGRVKPSWPEPGTVRLDASSSNPSGQLEYLWVQEDGTTTDGPKLDLGLTEGQTAPVSLLLTNTTGDTTLLDLTADGTPAPEPSEATSPPAAEPAFPDPSRPEDPQGSGAGSGGPGDATGSPPLSIGELGSETPGAVDGQPDEASTAPVPAGEPQASAPEVAGAAQEAEPGGPLARTGVQVGLLLAVAAGLVALGFVIKQLARREPVGEGSARVGPPPGGPEQPPSVDW